MFEYLWWRVIPRGLALCGAVLGVAMALTAGTGAAQQQAGVEAGGGRRSVWDGVYSESQAARGQAQYARACEKCHAVADDGVPRRFVGSGFWAKWGEDSLESLYTVVRRTMPNDAPGSLSDQAYADILAFFLRSNELPPGTTELQPSGIAPVWMSATRGAAGEIPEGAFVAVVGCLSKDANGWLVTRASRPQRARSSEPASSDAASLPPGNARFRLLYVISPLERYAGHKVSVRGLLVRRPSDGVNVTTVQSVGKGCEP